MDYHLNEDQAALVSAVQAILSHHNTVPQNDKLSFASFNQVLQNALRDGGFLDAGHEMGPLEAALITAEAARVPTVVEVAASAIIAPQLLPDERLEGPIALVSGKEIAKAHRNLPIAKTALVDLGEDVGVLAIDPANVAAVESVYAYPYGRFKTVPDLTHCRRLPGAGAKLQQWSRVALAAEIAGAAQAAVAFTVDYVKQRRVFGHPVGQFQSVQHRLVQGHQAAMAIYYLAMRAAWSGEAQDAAVAACYAQQKAMKLVFDLHQFNGAMGVTTEHLLHFWTYRIRALQSEAGGVYAAARDVAQGLWGVDNTPRPASAHGGH